MWWLSYAAIIVGEAFTGLFFLAAAIALLIRLRAPPARFERAKIWAVVAGAIGFFCLVRGFSCDRRRVVPDVAVPDLERSATCLPFRRDHAGGSHLHCAART